VAQLVANGLAQAGAALGGARALHAALADGAPSPRLLAALAASGVALAALRIHAAGAAERLGQDYVTRVRLRIFEATASRPARAGASRAGVTLARVITDLGSMRRWVSEGIARSLVAGVTLAAALGALALFHPPAALALGAVALGCAALAAALAPLLRGAVREARRRRSRLANNLGEKLLAAQTVQKLGRTERELARVRTQSGWLRDALVRRARAAESIAALPDLATPLALAAWLALRGASHPGELAAGVLVLGVLGAALRDLARALDARIAFEEGRRRIGLLLSGPRLAEKRRPRALAGNGPLAVEFASVTVEGALRDVELAVKPGERVLVTGAAGAGKTTLLALAARVLDPGAGQVRLDGQPLRALSLDALHEAVQLVSPELPLLRGSVAENVSYGAEGDDADWLESVARACGLVDDVALPEGLATQVEERGVNLPAGARARLALARALAMKPRLLLVDDPAFGSDPGARAALARALELLPMTVLCVGVAGSFASESWREWAIPEQRSGAPAP
jgi:ABC-type multidrug transport system fused ATPase/permease subunit